MKDKERGEKDMERLSLTQHAKAAAGKLKNSKLKRLTTISASLDAIRETLSLDNREQAMMLVAILDRQCGQQSTDTDDLANYFGCSTLDVMEYVPALLSLQAKGFIESANGEEENIVKRQYELCEDVFNAIVEGREVKPIPPTASTEFDQFNFCAKASELIHSRSQEKQTMRKALSRIQALEKEHAGLDLVKTIQAKLPDISDRAFFYEMVNDFTKDGDGGKSGVNSTLEDLFDSVSVRINQKALLMKGTHPLMATELVEAEDKDTLVLTDEAVKLLFGENANVYRSDRSGLDRYEFLAKVRDDIGNLPGEVEAVEKWKFIRGVRKLENKNPQLSAIANLLRLVENPQDRAIFYAVCYEAKDGDTLRFRQLSSFMPERDAFRETREFKANKHILQRHGLVEVCENGMFNDAALKLTPKGMELYFEEDAHFFENPINIKQLVSHEKVMPKRLFFESNLQRQLSMLTESLREDNYVTLQERLKEKGLPTGVAALLYGLPGTGKTESVWQLARQTGRDVLHVDISATKTCWFGESEKLIKEVFENYRRLCGQSKLKPILLFNEADAVFSKRKDANSSNVAQTENAIQNIILEEMERLDGILIATTNMADNLDKAFERRFLFKIRFDKPNPEAKSGIWLDKLPALREAEARQLASRFDFSGGEIDNVVRKATMEEILQGTAPTLEHLITLCEEERIEKGGQGIGFNK